MRLGQRTIQKRSSAPIILTGYQALNKLIGQDVYASNLQLGGPKIMHTNGVSHEVRCVGHAGCVLTCVQLVENDYEGILAVLRWLSYVPRVRGGPLPVLDMPDGEEVRARVGGVTLVIVPPRLIVASSLFRRRGYSTQGI